MNDMKIENWEDLYLLHFVCSEDTVVPRSYAIFAATLI